MNDLTIRNFFEITWGNFDRLHGVTLIEFGITFIDMDLMHLTFVMIFSYPKLLIVCGRGYFDSVLEIFIPKYGGKPKSLR